MEIILKTMDFMLKKYECWQVEHARAAIEAGEIGDIVTVQSDFPDKCYALTAAPLAYGAAALPRVAAAGQKPAGRPGAAVLVYPGGGISVNTFPALVHNHPYH